MDKGHQKLNLTNINISELTEIVIDSRRENARTKNINIISKITPNIYADIDESMIMRVFINLLSNAVAYGKIKFKVDLRLCHYCCGRALVHSLPIHSLTERGERS